jgi:hypothetical protein
MQHCWQHNVTYPPVNPSFQFQLFYLNPKKNTGGAPKLLNFIQWYASEKVSEPLH